MTSSVCVWLIEPDDSAYRARIEQALKLAGLSAYQVETPQAVPAGTGVVAIGPTVGAPLDAARDLRRPGDRTLLLFFTASRSASDALHAELFRHPPEWPRYELIEMPDTVDELATRISRVVQHSADAQAADHAQEYLATLLAQSNDAIFSTNHTGCISTWNHAAERLFGIPAEAAIGQRLDLLHVPDSPILQLEAILSRVLETGETEYGQVVCQKPDRTVVRISASVAPIRGRQGRLVGMSVVARENSDLERVEEARREATRQKSEFLAIMSHELRTPLTSILGYTDMVLRGLSGPLPPLANKYIGNIRSAGDRLLDLINGLLDYTRLEAGVERLEVRSIDLMGLVAQAVQHCQGAAGYKGLDLRLGLSDGVGRVEADSEKLNHVMRSLLGNALKFTPAGGWVAVRVEADPDAGDNVRVTVADSGIGMQPEQVPRVWERFYQGDASLTRPYGGMGLGLSIARELVMLHGGTVGAASRGPGMGSTFWFSLPRRRVGS